MQKQIIIINVHLFWYGSRASTLKFAHANNTVYFVYWSDWLLITFLNLLLQTLKEKVVETKEVKNYCDC